MLKSPVRANQSYGPHDFIVNKFEKASKNWKVLLCIGDCIMPSTRGNFFGQPVPAILNPQN
jgi:hypothetical protein